MTSFGGLLRRFEAPTEPDRQTTPRPGTFSTARDLTGVQPTPDSRRVSEGRGSRQGGRSLEAQQPTHQARQQRQPAHIPGALAHECVCPECDRRWRMFNIVFWVASIIIVLMLSLAVCLAQGAFSNKHPSQNSAGVSAATNLSSSTVPTIHTNGISTAQNSPTGSTEMKSTTEDKPPASSPVSFSAAPPRPPTSSPSFSSPAPPEPPVSISIKTVLIPVMTPSEIPDITTETQPPTPPATLPGHRRPPTQVIEPIPEPTTTIYSPVTTIFWTLRSVTKPTPLSQK